MTRSEAANAVVLCLLDEVTSRNRLHGNLLRSTPEQLDELASSKRRTANALEIFASFRRDESTKGTP